MPEPVLPAIASAFGWALLTSAWPIALISALICAVLAATRRQSPAFRYRVAAAGLLLSSALFIAGILDPLGSIAPANAWPSISSPPSPTATRTTLVDIPANPVLGWDFNPLILASLWLLGFSTGISRLFFAFRRVSRLRRVSVPLDTTRRQQMREIAAESGCRGPIDIRIAPDAAAPMVIGIRRPLVLVPPGFFESLKPAQAEAVLRHEAAHVARHDLLASMAQAVARSALFFHPGVHILSRTMDLEREKACDLMAGAAPERRRALASGLAAIATTSMLRPLLGTAAASGAPSAVLERLEHLTVPGDGGSFIRRRTRQLLHKSAMLIAISIVGAGAAATAREIRLPAEADMRASLSQLRSPLVPARLPADRKVLEVQETDGRQTVSAEVARDVFEAEPMARGEHHDLRSLQLTSRTSGAGALRLDRSEHTDEEEERRHEALERRDEEAERLHELAEQRREATERSVERMPTSGAPPPTR